MIRNETEYQEAVARLADERKRLKTKVEIEPSRKMATA